jgi:hypothetical protein
VPFCHTRPPSPTVAKHARRRSAQGLVEPVRREDEQQPAVDGEPTAPEATCRRRPGTGPPRRAGLWPAYRHGRAVLVEATWPGPVPSLPSSAWISTGRPDRSRRPGPHDRGRLRPAKVSRQQALPVHIVAGRRLPDRQAATLPARLGGQRAGHRVTAWPDHLP